MDHPQSITLNARTQGEGHVRVEVDDVTGRPLPEFTMEECRPITGEGFGLRPVWGDTSSLSAIAVEQVRVRITARRASLYAIGVR